MIRKMAARGRRASLSIYICATFCCIVLTWKKQLYKQQLLVTYYGGILLEQHGDNCDVSGRLRATEAEHLQVLMQRPVHPCYTGCCLAG